MVVLIALGKSYLRWKAFHNFVHQQLYNCELKVEMQISNDTYLMNIE